MSLSACLDKAQNEIRRQSILLQKAKKPDEAAAFLKDQNEALAEIKSMLDLSSLDGEENKGKATAKLKSILESLSLDRDEVIIQIEAKGGKATDAPFKVDDLETNVEPNNETRFIESPSGALEFGYITKEISAAIRRQAGSIRLREGNSAWGRAHIELRHGQDILNLGYSGVPEFVADIAGNFDAIYQGDKTTLVLAKLDKPHGKMNVVLELEKNTSGNIEYYDVKNATPIRADQFKNKTPIWTKEKPLVDTVGPNGSSAVADSLIPRDSSGNSSVANDAADSKATTKQVKDENGNPATEVTLPSGNKIEIQRLNATESMGLPGWHGPSGYLADTREGAVKALADKDSPGSANKDVNQEIPSSKNEILSRMRELYQKEIELNQRKQEEGADFSEYTAEREKIKSEKDALAVAYSKINQESSPEVAPEPGESGYRQWPLGSDEHLFNMLRQNYQSDIDAYSPSDVVSKLGSHWKIKTTRGNDHPANHATKKEAIEFAVRHKKLMQDQHNNPLGFGSIEQDVATRVIEAAAKLRNGNNFLSENEAYRQAEKDVAQEVERLRNTPEPTKGDKSNKTGDSGKVPLSSVIDSVNKKHGEGLTESDRIPNTDGIVEQHSATIAKMFEGELSIDEFKAAFALVRDNREAIEAELAKLKKDALLKMGGANFAYRYKTETKPVIIRGLYGDMLGDFTIGKTLSYFVGGNMADAKNKAIQKIVDESTQADMDAFGEKVKERRAENEKRAEEIKSAVNDPKTLDDFRLYLRAEMAKGKTDKEARMTMTPEQRAAYDNLAAEYSRKLRADRKETANTNITAAAVTTAGQLFETKHTKTGEDLFVVKTADRVERDVYNLWNATAKKLGGYYSSYRGNGAIPGFTFKEKDSALAFMQFVGGDAVAAQEAIKEERNAYADDKAQSAVERLIEMADRLDERADESLGQERKANTSRRARFAASAEAAASSDKALAKTMRNIANAISEGSAKFLDKVRQKSQVEMLRSTIGQAKYQELITKYTSYANQEQHKGEPATAETADFARWPQFTAMRSDLAALGRDLLQIDGAKLLGTQLLKVADDVSDAYTKFAKENLHKVSVFSMKKEGSDTVYPAIFSTEDKALEAINRSGHKGKAAVVSFKRGEHMVVMGPEMAKEKGLWSGDTDKRITLTPEFGEEIVAKNKAFGKRNRISMPYIFDNVSQERARWRAFGIETPAEMRAALREFVSLQERPAEADKIKQMERAMIGRKNDGLDFFPTPANTAQDMIDAAEIEPGMTVLEPSAGMGHIAEQIREAGVDPDVIEYGSDRRELLEAKGFRVVGNDFMEMSPRGFTFGDVFKDQDGNLGVMRGGGGLGSNRVGFQPLDASGQPDARTSKWVDRDELTGVEKRAGDSGYDRIIMNPPFSDRRDAEHVQHAFTLLKPGGRIVAIMGEGVFFGQDAKSKAFREWLDKVGGTSEKLEDGTFLDPSLPVNTGVNARMVVIDRPIGSVESPSFNQSAIQDYHDFYRENSKGFNSLPESDRKAGSVAESWGSSLSGITGDSSEGKGVFRGEGAVLRGSKYSSIANGIASDFSKNGITSLIGKKISGPADLAVAAQVYRDPRLETARYFFTKNGVIVGQTAFSSRKPGVTKIFPGSTDFDFHSHIIDVSDQMRSIGADSVWLLHNHPSGDPTPSKADIDATFIVGNAFVNQGININGHVIINSGKFAVIDANGKKVTDHDFGSAARYDLSKQKQPHALLGQNIESAQDLAMLAKKAQVSNGQIVIIGLSGSSGIRTINEITPAQLRGKFGARILGSIARQTGSERLFAYGISPEDSNAARKAINYGLIMDAIIVEDGIEYSIVDMHKDAKIKDGFSSGSLDEGITVEQPMSANFSDYRDSALNAASSVFSKETPSTIKNWIKSQMTQRRPFMLGFLTLDQIADVYGKAMDSVKRFASTVQAMDTEKQKIADEADKIVERWRQLDSKEADRLADIMHEATIMQYDPESTAPDDPAIDAMKPQEKLYERFNDLSKDAQQIYRDVRDDYKKTIEQVRDGLANRIDRASTTGWKIGAEIRLEFDKYLEEGPYFPLARFGDFILISDNGVPGQRIVESFETVFERDKMKAQRLKDGYKPNQVKETTKQAFTSSKDGAAGQFANDVIKHVQAMDMDLEAKTALIDDLNQLAISSLPDQSYRKHFMHRKGVAGFSNDAMRAFANSQFHAAHHIAKINHADQLSFIIDEITKEAGDAKSGDVTEPIQIANELKKRLEDIVNPKTGPVAAAMGQVGFVMSLGGNLASGVTNLSQTPMITFPWLGAKFGYDKAAIAMTKATKDYFGGRWDKWSGYVLQDNPSLTDGERKMLKELQDGGKIDLTQAHDLAAVANQNSAQSKGAYARSRAMKIIGWTFHLPEVFNRQSSALAAYRLATESGMSHADAVAYASNTLDRTHFNYAQSNRARHMNGDLVRVLTMFKQYSQQMTYMLWRNTYQALKGETPEVRREARRLLAGILTMHFMAAGSLGLPLGAFGISTILLPILSMSLGDGDDPWDWEVEYRKMLADTFGTKGGEIIAHGALRGVLPWADFAGRIGLNDLWVRPPAKEMEGRAAIEAWMQTLAGPVFGYVGNVGTAAKLMTEGNFGRGVEAMVPKMLSAPMKAVRYATDGVQSMKGDDLGIKLDALDIAFTAAGFSPTDTSEMYEARNAIKNREHLLDMRRKQIMNQWYQAKTAGDSDGVREANEMAKHFNMANKETKGLQITPATLARSAASKERNADQIKVGAYLSKGRESLRSEGRFADVSSE